MNYPKTHTKFQHENRVQKIKGSQWHGRVCGWYTTDQTPEGYVVESEREKNSVQDYPAHALELVEEMEQGTEETFEDKVLKNLPEENYERDHSHVHCFESKKPPCGQRIAHLECCLCEILNPIVATLLESEKEEAYNAGRSTGMKDFCREADGKRAVLQELRRYVGGFGYSSLACSTILSEIKRLEDTV